MSGWVKALQTMQEESSPEWHPVAKFYDVPSWKPESVEYSTNSASSAADPRKHSKQVD